MKHKVSELEGALLDAAVAKAEGWCQAQDDKTAWWAPDGSPFGPVASITHGGIRGRYGYHPAHNWEHGGPIIERERIYIGYCGDTSDDTTWPRQWFGQYDDEREGGNCHHVGTTPLIAAMRAYVASKFGEEVDLP